MAVRKTEQGQLLFVHFLEQEAKSCVYTILYLFCLEKGEIIPAMCVQFLVLLPILQNRERFWDSVLHGIWGSLGSKVCAAESLENPLMLLMNVNGYMV